jgi:hypothetical protein
MESFHEMVCIRANISVVFQKAARFDLNLRY